MSIFDRRLKYVNCKTWVRDAQFAFPEIGDPELAVGHIAARPNIGIAFSGGGTRAASATLGQLRALDHLGLLKNARYISAVSGGAWAAAPYTFLGEGYGDQTFLGQVREPESLDEMALKDLDTGSFAHAISQSAIMDDFLRHALLGAGDETYSRAIGNIFLKPFGQGDLDRFFTQDADSRDTIIQNDRNLTVNDFHITHSGRPFFIAGATFLRIPFGSFQATKYHVEITPLYTGMYAAHDVGRGRKIGGGYLEPLGFDSVVDKADRVKKERLLVRLGSKGHRFTLSDVLGTTGAAPGEILNEFRLGMLGFPEFRTWHVPSARSGKAVTKEYEYSDGGNLENLGVIPLLLRKVDRMVVFVNTKEPLPAAAADPGDINQSIRCLFGQPQPDGYTGNHVFPADKFDSLARALHGKHHAGEPAIHRDTYPVLQNDLFGVEKGTVEVLWVYNDLPANWVGRLPAGTRDRIGRGELGNFPHYETFFQNKPRVIDLSPLQVSLLAHLTEWCVLEGESGTRDFSRMLA